ncbi:MAG: NAD(P)H-hydrate dehydratase [Candidatus Diapherotrites archaeon]|uniref:ADP-dependent (S)-NAD(P)H-hydrate dehydratase n=1 Tax=Candidatus Iainarchaeum sp. TaxID=3101447 RepID=A0A938YXZ7_9ARCH|nr:NAD(P)H-hydrate dehydratase [Candidatus Diapherotrites archaeon]
MESGQTTKQDILSLAKRQPKSHKGSNGIVLIVAGSAQYHGASIFAGITASRIVDLVYFATAQENIIPVKNASSEFIVLKFNNMKTVLPGIDSILVGPGLEDTQRMRDKLHNLIAKNKSKKIVIDATALRQIDPRWLHPNCVVTPHADEFKGLFKMNPTKENAAAAAKKFNCLVVLKGATDYISDGNQLIENHTGNAGMTTGGTGDILAGLIVGFAAKNPLLLSAKAGCFLNGFAADLLQKEKGTMWNATDLMHKLPDAKKQIEKV